MNDRKDNNIPECLYPGDPRACMLLGAQKKPAEDKKIRRSCFVHVLYIKGQYLLFHTLTRKILLLEPKYIDYFADDRLFPSSVLEEELPAKLYSDHFLVPEDEQESRTYLELKDILVLKEELPKGITHYVILPTTICNARCFYCFEQGMRYHKMSNETVEDTLRFILEHKPAGDKKIHIHWFGGEPLCAWDNIDRICAGLKDAGIAYTAEMTSNGSLFRKKYDRIHCTAVSVRHIARSVEFHIFLPRCKEGLGDLPWSQSHSNCQFSGLYLRTHRRTRMSFPHQ